MLGSDGEGLMAISAQEEQHGVREGIEGEVGPVLQGGSWLDPRERQTTARVTRAQGPVVW